MFALYKFINTKFSPGISTSSIRNLPSESLVFLLAVTLFVPRKAIKTHHEFDVLCEEKALRQSHLSTALPWKNSTQFRHLFV